MAELATPAASFTESGWLLSCSKSVSCSLRPVSSALITLVKGLVTAFS